MQSYYSSQAAELERWAREEPNRLKASKIYRTAQSLERRYRSAHKSEVDDPYRRPAGLPPSTGLSVQYIHMHGANHPLCIRCNRPVEDLNKIIPGDKPTARVICELCYGD